MLPGNSLPWFYTVVVLVEGYKREKRDKIEIYRPEISESLLCENDPNVVAVVSYAPLDVPGIRIGFGSF